ADANPARFENRERVEGDAVLVHGDAGAVEDFLRLLSVDVLRTKIDKHQMVVGAAGGDAVAVFRQSGGERLRVYDHLPLVIAELRLEGFVKANGLGGDDVHERSSLH